MKVYVAGHRGLVGSAIVRELRKQGVEPIVRTHTELDLKNQREVSVFFHEEQPDQVYVAAAHVGGIVANSTRPAQFIYDNLMITANIIEASRFYGVKRLLFLGSSCIYPKFAAQPMQESTLLTGELEPTNEPYAIAKISGIKMCESYRRQYGCDFRSLMPTNLYGPGDNYHPENSHVIPGLIGRFHEAKVSGAESVTVWGRGHALREFLYVDDLAEACVHFMNIEEDKYWSSVTDHCSHINIGTGRDIAICDLIRLIRTVVGYEGVIVFDTTKPDGTPRKLLDVSLANRLGWTSKTGLAAGLAKTYAEYVESLK